MWQMQHRLDEMKDIEASDPRFLVSDRVLEGTRPDPQITRKVDSKHTASKLLVSGLGHSRMMPLSAKSQSCRHPNKLARMHSKVPLMLDLHGMSLRFQFKSGSFYVSGPVRQAVIDKLNKKGGCDFEFKAADPDCTCSSTIRATTLHTSTSVTLNKLRSTRRAASRSAGRSSPH